uniref:Uncharacterized protein n=1 Tax=Panagrolaimus sp. PS1159 TaxID=55785 RepID=A0AC35GCQ6_9BILA
MKWNALLYPHKHLEKFYKEYDEIATSPLPAALMKRHNEMKELYQRIKESENNLEKWFSLLFKANDKKFIIHNVEYRIGRDLLNKKLWKIYIKYLKDGNDFHGLFHLYSKYCRFFLDDYVTKAEYETEVKKLTYNELKFFIESGNVELLDMYDSKITDEKNENVPLEDILKLVPKIRYFQKIEIKCTPKTAEILANFNFQNKIKSMELMKLYGTPLNVEAFKEFSIKNMGKTFVFALVFQEGSVTDEFCLNFKEAMEDKKYFSEKSINRMEIDIRMDIDF